jgi:hypothetical protein
MNEQIIESRFTLHTLNLNAPSGSLAVKPDKLVLKLDDAGHVQECRFLFDVSYETWQRIDAEGLLIRRRRAGANPTWRNFIPIFLSQSKPA